jgi:hypothetical protein
MLQAVEIKGYVAPDIATIVVICFVVAGGIAIGIYLYKKKKR